MLLKLLVIAACAVVGGSVDYKVTGKPNYKLAAIWGGIAITFFTLLWIAG